MKTVTELWQQSQNDAEGMRLGYTTQQHYFAALVRADEREAWEHKYARLQSLMEIRETQPNKPCCLDEREACAKMCDVIAQKMDDEGEGPTGNICWVIDCAEAIRARGDK
jgi:hypothetical protein